MRYLASRVAIVGGVLFFPAWVGSSLLATAALGLESYGPLTVLSRVAWTTDLPLFGFLGLMIFALADHFVPLFSGRELRSPRLALIQVLFSIASVVLLLALSWSAVFGRTLWLITAVWFVVQIVATWTSGKPAPRRDSRTAALSSIDWRARLITSSAWAYLPLGSLGLVLNAPGGDPLVPALAGYGSSFVHLYVGGFVTLALFGFVLHLLPRFLEVVPAARWVSVLAALAIPSPIGVALSLPFAGTDDPRGALLVGFAAAEAMASIVFAGLVFGMWRRSSRRRPAASFSVLGGGWLILGSALAVYMAMVPGGTSRWLPAHGWIVLLGFATFEIFGLIHEILLPYVTGGLRSWRLGVRAHEVFATLGLLSVLLSAGLAVEGFPRFPVILGFVGFGLLLAMGVSVAVGTLRTVAAISRPVAAHRTAP